MTEEEKAAALAAEAADAKAKQDEEALKNSVQDVNLIAEKDAKIAKLIEERDNYKTVALKRLGKLPGDADFLGGKDEDGGELSVAEQVRIALLDNAIESERQLKELETARIIKENSELRLALKNRPGGSIGGDSGANVTTKDNVLSDNQIIELKAKAKRLNVDPEKFVQNFKNNLIARG